MLKKFIQRSNEVEPSKAKSSKIKPNKIEFSRSELGKARFIRVGSPSRRRISLYNKVEDLLSLSSLLRFRKVAFK